MIKSWNIMKKALLIILAFPLFFLSFSSPISSVEGFGISSEEFHFFISQPEVLAFEEMKFSVSNHESEDMLVNVSFEHIEGVNVSVEFSWTSILLRAGNSAINQYKIHVFEQFNITFPLQISAIGVIQNNATGQKIVGGGVVVNYITYYGDNSAYLFDLHILDQSGKPRIADIRLYYKTNHYSAFSPFKVYNSSTISAFYPEGFYQIFARDLDFPNIFVEHTFFLDNASSLFLTLEMIRFSRFEFIADNANHLGVNLTIDNNADPLLDVEVFCELFLDGKKLDQTTSKGLIMPVLPTIQNYPFKLWFSFEDWKEASYEVKGYIFSLGELIVERKMIMPLTDVAIQVVKDNLLVSALFLGLFLLIIVSLSINFIFKKRSQRYIEKHINLE